MLQRLSWSKIMTPCLLITLLVACTSVTPELEGLGASNAEPLVIEPEAKNVIDDPEAEGGQAAILYHQSNESTFTLGGVPSGTYQVKVRARADEFQGWPKLRLYLGDKQLGEDNPVERERYSEDEQGFGEAELKEGQVITARFLNDRYGGSADRDRNLIIDHLTLTPVSEAGSPSEPSSPLQDEVQLLVDDMSQPHESKLHGVPGSLNWAHRPRVGMGNDPEGFRALAAWGQLYEADEGNPATNTRVQIRNLRAYVLSRSTGQWRRVQDAPSVAGNAYREDYADDINKPGDVRPEASGGISVTAGDGYNYHFWAHEHRVEIDPNDIAGVITTVEARLILDDADLADDRGEARYLLGVGADYWLSMTAQWDQWRTNGDIGIGRHKFVRKNWSLFTMSTLDEEELQANPPPSLD